MKRGTFWKLRRYGRPVQIRCLPSGGNNAVLGGPQKYEMESLLKQLPSSRSGYQERLKQVHAALDMVPGAQ